MAGEITRFDNDAKSVDVDLTATVAGSQVAVVEGILGILNKGGDSGDTRALTIDDRAYQFTVPSTLTVNKGDTVHVDITQITGHVPDDAAYSTDASGTTPVALFKALTAKDENDVVIGKLISGYQV